MGQHARRQGGRVLLAKIKKRRARSRGGPPASLLFFLQLLARETRYVLAKIIFNLCARLFADRLLFSFLVRVSYATRSYERGHIDPVGRVADGASGA